MKPLGIVLAALSLTGVNALAGCGSSDSDDGEESQAEQRKKEESARKAVERRERERKLGELIRRAQEEEARKTQRNLQRHQEGSRTCPPGQDYLPQFGTCLSSPGRVYSNP